MEPTSSAQIRLGDPLEHFCHSRMPSMFRQLVDELSDAIGVYRKLAALSIWMMTWQQSASAATLMLSWWRIIGRPSAGAQKAPNVVANGHAVGDGGHSQCDGRLSLIDAPG
jgi:hypothetical protein